MNNKQVIKWCFSKWLVSSIWLNKTPDTYSQDLMNVRIKNQWITVRKWYSEIVYDTNWKFKHIFSNQYLFVIQWSTVYKVVLWTLTSYWTVSNVSNYNSFRFWEFVIICDWINKPYICSGANVFQVTTTIDSWVIPSFWSSFAWFSVINNVNKKNILYVSVPVWTNTIFNCYDWNGSWSEQIVFKSDILWVIWTLFHLWIFTETTIEYISKDSLTTEWWIASLYSIPVWYWWQLNNNNCIVWAGDKIFYLTKDKKIRSILYKEWIIQEQIGDISDVPLIWIDDLLQWLNDNQDSAFGFFDRKNNLVKFFVRSVNSTVNDICIIYDMVNQCFLLDNNKNFAGMTEYNNNIYANSVFDGTVYIDEYWQNDNDLPINWWYKTISMWLWIQTIRKQFRGMTFWWAINDTTDIWIEIYIDDRIVFTNTLKGINRGWNSSVLGIGNTEIWGSGIWGDVNKQTNNLKSFDCVLTQWNLRDKWKRISIKFYGNSDLAPQFILDYLDIDYRPIWNYDKSDKYFS